MNCPGTGCGRGRYQSAFVWQHRMLPTELTAQSSDNFRRMAVPKRTCRGAQARGQTDLGRPGFLWVSSKSTAPWRFRGLPSALYRQAPLPANYSVAQQGSPAQWGRAQNLYLVSRTTWEGNAPAYSPASRLQAAGGSQTTVKPEDKAQLFAGPIVAGRLRGYYSRRYHPVRHCAPGCL